MIIEEMSGLFNDKDAFYQIYKLATAEPYSFLYINLKATSIDDMFFINFNRKLRIKDI